VRELSEERRDGYISTGLAWFRLDVNMPKTDILCITAKGFQGFPVSLSVQFANILGRVKPC